MKIKTEEQLEDALDQDLCWRKKELTTLKFSVSSARNHQKEVLMRAAIAMFYAHWEGHVKYCAKVFLCYLNGQAYSCANMTDNFTQLTLAERFKEGFSIKKFESQKAIFDYIISKKTESFFVNENTVIDTESNLKHDVILNIMSQLGLDTSAFELKKHFIDSKLVGYRNGIAHGEQRTGRDLEDIYNELQKELLDMIMIFHNLIRNTVTTKSYLKNP